MLPVLPIHLDLYDPHPSVLWRADRGAVLVSQRASNVGSCHVIVQSQGTWQATDLGELPAIAEAVKALGEANAHARCERWRPDGRVEVLLYGETVQGPQRPFSVRFIYDLETRHLSAVPGSKLSP